MFLYHFGDDLVLALEFVAQRGDGAMEVAVVGGVPTLEGGGAVLEERLLLPSRERTRVGRLSTSG
ncbi:MAG: hypothetical protein ACLP7Q_03420 [Isosphaeraceae bacterium]